MNKKLYLTAFVIGVASGSLATLFYVKRKYEKIAQKEIDSVKEIFTNRKNDNFKKDTNQTKAKSDTTKYTSILQKEGYKYYLNGNDEEKIKEDIMKRPYVISPDEFGEIDNYEKISLTYYADGVLADDNDEIIYDVENIVGDALNHFGEYEDDSVFVRCEAQKCDYEILLDQRDFSQVVQNKPHQVGLR